MNYWLQFFWFEKNSLLNDLFCDFLYILVFILQHLDIIFFPILLISNDEFFYTFFLLNVDT